MKEIPKNLFNKILKRLHKLPIKKSRGISGIYITEALVRVTLEILNDAEGNTLPQNCRNETAEHTPDGLDKRIKLNLPTDTRTANIVSDFLSEHGIVEIVDVLNPETNRMIRGTHLLKELTW